METIVLIIHGVPKILPNLKMNIFWSYVHKGLYAICSNGAMKNFVFTRVKCIYKCVVHNLRSKKDMNFCGMCSIGKLWHRLMIILGIKKDATFRGEYLYKKKVIFYNMLFSWSTAWFLAFSLGWSFARTFFLNFFLLSIPPLFH